MCQSGLFCKVYIKTVVRQLAADGGGIEAVKNVIEALETFCHFIADYKDYVAVCHCRFSNGRGGDDARFRYKCLCGVGIRRAYVNARLVIAEKCLKLVGMLVCPCSVYDNAAHVKFAAVSLFLAGCFP